MSLTNQIKVFNIIVNINSLELTLSRQKKVQKKEWELEKFKLGDPFLFELGELSMNITTSLYKDK